MQVSIKNLSKIVSGDFNDPFVDGDTIIVKDGLIKEIGDVSEKKIKESNVIINANGSIAIPGLIDSHVHITFGDYTPRQNTVGFLQSYLHGGTTTCISASEVHVPGRPKDVDLSLIHI